MAQDEWLPIENNDEWVPISRPSQPTVNPPSSFMGRVGELGEGLMGFGRDIYESGFGNPMALFGNMIREGPEKALEAPRRVIQGAVIDPIKSLWEGAMSPEPYGMLQGAMRAGGLSPENIKQDYQAGNYGALAGDIVPQALLGYATHRAFGGGKAEVPLSKALIPDEILPPIITEQRRLMGKVEAPPIEPPAPLQLEGIPQRLGLPAMGESTVTGPTRFIQGPRGTVDASMNYPIDMADPAKMRGMPMSPEDIAQVTPMRPDISGEQILGMMGDRGTLLPNEIGQLGSLNPMDVASGNFGGRYAQGLPIDRAQVNPAFASLVPDRFRSPNELIEPNAPLAMRGPTVEPSVLEQPIGGRVVEPPPMPQGPLFSAGTIPGEEASLLRPKAPKEQPYVYPPGAKLEPTRTNIDADNIQYQLRDVGKDMNPSVRKAGVSSIPEIQAAAAQVRAERPGFIRNTYDYLGTSGWSILDNMGEGGKNLSRFMRKTRAEGSAAAGSVISKYRAPIDKLSATEFATAVDHIEANTAAKSPKIQSAVTAIKGLLDESGQFAENSGMVMANPSGQLTKFQRMKEGYFPHKWAPGTFDEGSLVNQLIQKGMSPQQAKFVVEQGIKSGPRLISPQHMRSLGLGGYLKTKGALLEHVDDLMTRSAEARNYGPTDLGNKNSPIMQMIGQTADPERALNIVRDQLGRIKKDPDLERVAAGVNTFEATVKLPLFAISNMNQSAAIGMRASTKNFVSGFIDTIKNIKSAEDTGALQTTAVNILKETGQNVFTQKASKLFGWQKSEEFLRSWAANSGKAQADSLFSRLKKDPMDMTARAQLDDLLLEDVNKVMEQQSLTDQQRKIAGFRMSELTQGLVDPADLPPMWNGNPLLRIPLMFKRFAFQQNKILKEALGSAKTPQEKAMMATKILALYTVTGEVTKDVKSLVANIASGKDPFEGIFERGNTPMGRILGNISNAYALGLAGEIIEQTASGSPDRVLKFLAGPAISDVVNLGIGASRSIAQGDIAPFGREAVKMTPMGYATSDVVFPPQ